MPTGYTASIEDGKITSGKDFLMLCARAFGACIEMRDDSLTAPIPSKFTPSTYYKTRVEEAEENLNKLLSLTIADAQDQIDKEYQSNQRRCAKAIEKQEKIWQKYKDIREDVQRWKPPTPMHEELKKFALKQIDISCDGDGMIACWEEEMRIPKASPEEWLCARIKSEREDLKRCKEMWQEELEKTDEKNMWLSRLRESLSQI